MSEILKDGWKELVETLAFEDGEKLDEEDEEQFKYLYYAGASRVLGAFFGETAWQDQMMEELADEVTAYLKTVEEQIQH